MCNCGLPYTERLGVWWGLEVGGKVGGERGAD